MVDLKLERLARNMSQNDLARALKVSQSTVCLIENGKRGYSKRMAIKLSKLFGIEITEFFE